MGSNGVSALFRTNFLNFSGSTVEKFSTLILPLVILTLPLSALAQAPTPGEVGETLRPGGIPLLKEKEPPPLPSPPVRERPAAPADERRVRIERFAFSGTTLYSEERLRQVVADYEGRELTLSEIYQAADQLTDFFQQEGYSLTTATVPAQKMKGGVLRIEVVEGRVGKLLFTGNSGYSDELLARRMAPLEPGAVVRFDQLERRVLLVNDLPGMLARSVMLPGEEYGTTDIELDIEESRWSAQAVLDNHGPEVVGKWRAAADFTINNPLKRGDVLGFGYTHTQSSLLKQGRFNYGLPVGHGGATLNFSYSRAEYDVGGEFKALGVEGSSENGSIQLRYPQIRSRRTNLNWQGGAVRTMGSSDIGDIPLSDDTIHYLEAGFNFDHRHKNGASSTLSAMLATNFQSNSDGMDNEALPPRLEVKGSHEYPWGRGWSIFLRAQAVLATDNLPDSNKFSLGGPTSIRGFTSSAARGDQGVMGTLELRRVLEFDSMLIQARGFVDSGSVHSRSTLVAPSSSQELSSAGVGLNAMLGAFVLDGAWAIPVDDHDSGEGRDSQFWFSLTAGF